MLADLSKPIQDKTHEIIKLSEYFFGSFVQPKQMTFSVAFFLLLSW